MAPPLLDLHLPRSSEAGVLARRWLQGALGGAVSPSALADARLVVSELVANAMEHGRGDVRLRVELRPGRVRIEVIDQGSGQAPAVRKRPGDASGGWGLRIVDALSVRWGAFEGTTHVWAELPAEA